MTETPSSPELATRPVVTESTPPVVEREPRRGSRVTTAAAWVGIVAGDKDRVMIHRGGPGFMGPGGPGAPGFGPGGPGGPGSGPGFERPEQPPAPPSPTTTAPARP